MKIFENAEIELISFSTEDVITTSSRLQDGTEWTADSEAQNSFNNWQQ